MPAIRPQTFPRAVRIRESRDFARLKDSGKRLTQGCLILNWNCGAAESADAIGESVIRGGTRMDSAPAPFSPTRLGVITSRRIGGAVVRNRARRLLREAFRSHRARLQPGCDLVIIARKSIQDLGFDGVEFDFLVACRRAKLLQPEAAAV